MRLFRFRLGDYSTNNLFVQDFFLLICYNIDMLISEKNEYGVVTIDDGLIYQLFTEAIKPLEGKARYVGDREVRYGENGLYASTGISIRIGSSINGICGSIIDYIVRVCTEDLEIPVDDIVIEVLQMTTSKNTVKRNIRVSYRGGIEQEE